MRNATACLAEGPAKEVLQAECTTFRPLWENDEIRNPAKVLAVKRAKRQAIYKGNGGDHQFSEAHRLVIPSIA